MLVRTWGTYLAALDQATRIDGSDADLPQHRDGIVPASPGVTFAIDLSV